ncbi:MAG: hypothetical protein AAF762_08710 [Pseudomonadota bacterium]
MFDLFVITPEGAFISAITCLVLREVILISLPNELVGPGGRWIDTHRGK